MIRNSCARSMCHRGPVAIRQAVLLRVIFAPGVEKLTAALFRGGQYYGTPFLGRVGGFERV